ncbi:o-succinylbenzoate synthase [Martelella alba]|uniref:o-succinylbenzoate synthase n=1 Tax=Martelella alba TaxID=2590451 RepID=A0ABY2SHI5_9HYPH|nr:o-succinylbenzoate synthase [Martelella alba]TKI04780.1 o-succinylbenzoate synthase [Martelella alba]
MRQASLFRYSLPLDAGAVLRRGRPTRREGLVVRLAQGGRIGEGEIAPLPGFSQESLQQAADAARRWLAIWAAEQPDRLNGANPARETDLDGIPPSAAFGISCALAELAGRLPARADFQSVPLCRGEPEQWMAQLAGRPGPSIAKIKVALGEPPAEAGNINRLLAALPDWRLRLDANRSWTLAEAAAFAAGLDRAVADRIDFIEEPCADPKASLAFARRANLPIAWDESVRDPGFRPTAQPGVAAVIVKPTLIGGLERCANLICAVRQAGLTAVVSSSVESSLGLTQLARLAAWLTPGVPPGLDTLALMGAQLLRRWPGSALPLQAPSALQRESLRV